MASVIFGLLLAVFPGAGALTVVWLIGAYALVFGLLLLGLAYRLWRAHGPLSQENGVAQSRRGGDWLHLPR